MAPVALGRHELVHAFAPFDSDEWVTLGVHVQAVKDLAGTTFAQPGTLTWRMDVDLSQERQTPADDALGAVMTNIRRLLRDDRGNFHQTRHILRNHAIAVDAPEARKAVVILDAAGKDHKRILKESTRGYVLEETVDDDGSPSGSRRPTPRELVEDYLHGRTVHSDVDKRPRYDEWTGFHRWALVDAADALMRFYRLFGLGPAMILREAGLRASR